MVSDIRRQIGFVLPLFNRLIKSSPRRVGLVLTLMCVSSFTSGVGILFIVPLLESVGVPLGSASNDIADRIRDIIIWLGLPISLELILFVYLLLMSCIGFLSYLNTVLTGRLHRKFVISLRLETYEKILSAQWQYLNQERMSGFTRLLLDQVMVVGAAVNQLLSLLSSCVLFLTYMLFAFFLSPTLTLLVLGLGLMLVLMMLPINRHLHLSGRLGLIATQKVFHSVIEHLGNLKIIKSFAARDYFFEKVSTASVENEEQELRVMHYTALSRLFFLLGSAVIFTSTFYLSICCVTISLANLLVVLFIFSRLMPQVSSIQNIVQRLVHMSPDYELFVENSLKLDRYVENVSKDKVFLGPTKAVISLDNVSYKYPDSNGYVFRGVSAKIKKNSTVAITGESGSGKSTLVDIISGLIPPADGQLLVDTTPIDDTNRVEWRKRVAYVTQEVLLFNESIRDNLTWVSKKNIAEEKIWKSLELASAVTFVRNLPNKLETVIGDHGTRLSGGERQRLVLARALLSEPEILILDEATSALDRENELVIRDAIRKLEGYLTVIIIAHNDTTIEHAHSRIELRKEAFDQT